MTDPRHAALRAAQDELDSAGAVSPSTARRVMAALGLVDNGRLARDEALRRLATYAQGQPWTRARAVSGWLTRWARGDNLDDAPREVRRLCDEVGEALCTRTVFRVLAD